MTAESSATFVFLGTGASLGIPVVGCRCPICRSCCAKNQRLRTSAMLHIGCKRFLVDCGPDFRQQALREGVDRIDGLILTHAHYDHIAALDEMRLYSKQDRPLPTLLSQATAKEVQERFSYLFAKKAPGEQKDISKLQLHLLPADGAGSVDFCGLKTEYVTYEQAGMQVNGFIWGNLAYLTDIRHFSDAIFASLQRIEILIVGALRYSPSHFHFSIKEAADFSLKTSAKQVWLTHLSHEIDHEAVSGSLPHNIHLAYDGLQLPFKKGFQ